MTDIKVSVPYIICTTCTNGTLVYTGIAYYTMPLLYEHKCNCCGHKENLLTVYNDRESSLDG